MMRLFEITGFRLVDINPQSRIYQALDQAGLLSGLMAIFPADRQQVTVFWLEAENDPVELAKDASWLSEIVKREVNKGFVDGHCRFFQAKTKVETMMPKSGRIIGGLWLAHLIGHVVLPYAVRCRTRLDITPSAKDFQYEERVKQNSNNPREFLLAFNFPLRVDHVSTLIGLVIDYLDAWMKGNQRYGLQREMHRQALIFDESRLRT